MRTWRLIGGSKPTQMMHTGPTLKPMETAEVIELAPMLDLLELTMAEGDEAHPDARAFLGSHRPPKVAA